MQTLYRVRVRRAKAAVLGTSTDRQYCGGRRKGRVLQPARSRTPDLFRWYFQARRGAWKIEIEADRIIRGPFAKDGIGRSNANDAVAKRGCGGRGTGGLKGIHETVACREEDAFRQDTAGGERRHFALVQSQTHRIAAKSQFHFLLRVYAPISGIHIEARVANKADESHLAIAGGLDGKARRAAHGGQHRSAGARRLLHQFETSAAG